MYIGISRTSKIYVCTVECKHNCTCMNAYECRQTRREYILTFVYLKNKTLLHIKKKTSPQTFTHQKDIHRLKCWN